MGRPAEDNPAILIRPVSRSHPRRTVRLASPRRAGLGPRDRWLVAGRAAIRSRAAAYRTSAASPTGSAPARNQHQLPAPGRERVQSAAGSSPFPAGGCTPSGSGRTDILLADSPFLCSCPARINSGGQPHYAIVNIAATSGRIDFMAHPVATTRDASNRSPGIAGKVPTGLLVGGVWREASGRARFDVEDPATGMVIASVADAGAEDAVRALGSAVDSARDWAAASPRTRSDVLRRAFDSLTARKAEFAGLITA